MKKPIPRKGNCYHDAYEWLALLGPMGWKLCHGVCIGTGEYNKGKPYGHAWIENESTVIDASGTAVFKELYYKVGQVQRVKRFTLEQARELHLKRNRPWGPWYREILIAEKWINGR